MKQYVKKHKTYGSFLIVSKHGNENKFALRSTNPTTYIESVNEIIQTNRKLCKI